MDEREWSAGKVVVEIQARGQGIIPSLEELFDFQQQGFALETVDSSLSVSQFVSDGNRKAPQADRNWQLTYRRNKDLQGDVMFRFPALKAGIQPTSVEYKHYQDADLITVNAQQAAAGVKLSSQVGNGLRNAILIGLLVAAFVGLVTFLRRRKASAHTTAEALTVPDPLTPFSAVAFLRRIQQHHASRLGENERSALDTQIAQLEAAYFSGSKSSTPDLSAVTATWLRAVS
jgi:hypothetical protein